MQKGKLSSGRPRNFDYPESDEASQLARAIRSETNRLTDEERERLFKKGMQIIYGGSGTTEKVGR